MQIKKYLQKYINLKTTPQANKKIILSAIKNTTKQELDESSVKIFKNAVYITTDPYKKNTIILNKKRVIEEINNSSSLEIKNIY